MRWNVHRNMISGVITSLVSRGQFKRNDYQMYCNIMIILNCMTILEKNNNSDRRAVKISFNYQVSKYKGIMIIRCCMSTMSW